MDAIVGRIVNAVDEHGGRERTLVLFTSDNGTARDIVSKQSGREVRGGKGLPNDRGTHVPLIARWPGTVPAGRTDGSLIDFTDFFVTLLDVTATRHPDDPTLDGHSFAEQLRGRTGSPRDWLFCYYNPRPERDGFARGRFARDHTHKLYGDGRLFDLAADPEERQPISIDSDEPSSVAARKKLAAAIAAFPEHPARIAEEHREP